MTEAHDLYSLSMNFILLHVYWYCVNRFLVCFSTLKYKIVLTAWVIFRNFSFKSMLQNDTDIAWIFGGRNWIDALHALDGTTPN